MRKTAAILLLTLIVFNTTGYKLWFYIAMQQADTKLISSLDKKEYKEQELFTLKVPMNMPYQNNTNSFERVDGEITIKGETYKYVQRKVENDTLTIQCIRHAEKIALQQNSNDYFGKVNGVSDNSPSKKMPAKNTSIVKFSLSDFIHETYTLQHNISLENKVRFAPAAVSNNSFNYLQKIIKPPQAV